MVLMVETTYTDMSTNTYQGALRQVIRERIGRTGLSCRRVSKLSGFHPDYLTHVLRGIRPVTFLILTLVGKVLGTTKSQICKEAKALSD